MEQSAGLMSFLLPGHEMQEAQNKLQAFRLFAYVDRELHLSHGRTEPLDVLARRAQRLSAYRKIWAVEGVSHFHVSSYEEPETLHRLLIGPDIPETAMVPMHAGMGTCFASTVLSRLNGDSSKAALRAAADRFLEWCGANARPGWLENAVEPLGLGVRSLYPHLLSAFNDIVGEINEQTRHLFWHGVGRSLYFVPMNFVTFGGSHERALKTAVDEAPAIADRRNAVAGLAWAVTLVNICHPAVLRSFLRAADRMALPEALTNGITSALMIWKHMVPEDREFLPVYLRSDTGSARDATLWNRLVSEPARCAFAETYPALVAQNRVASLFEYKESYG